MNTETPDEAASLPRYLAARLCSDHPLPGRADRALRTLYQDLQSMRTLDWVVLVASLVFVIAYGL